ncbi:MAG: four-carbon acid sugar kinase family protein [Aristaeellaceae bacterium]
MDKELNRLNAAETFAACESLWACATAREDIDRLFAESYPTFDQKVIVLDDDPTGVQTVHDVAVVTDWAEDTLYAEMVRPDPMFFVLTNSRSFSAERTQEAHREIAAHVLAAARRAGKDFLIVCRGDSTLRGHLPMEEAALSSVIEENGGAAFDGEILCPFFKEGGRYTLDSVHYVQEGDMLVPAAQTEFARDKTFGYGHSFLPAYIEEKTHGQVKVDDVLTVTLRELRSLDLDAIEAKLTAAEGFRYIAVDAIEEADVKAFAVVLMRLMRRGRHYMIRSAAAVPKALGNVSSRPLLSREELIGTHAEVGGMVLAGSHVKKTTAQLNCLKASACPMVWIEFNASRYAEEGGLEAETARVTALAEEAMQAGKTAVVYTSRTLIAPEGASAEEMLAISVRISNAVTAVVAGLHFRPRFLIAKGGITSSDVGVKALQVRRAWVLGQAQPGIPVWQTGEESKFPGLSYIIFPGNVGAESTLRAIVEALA